MAVELNRLTFRRLVWLHIIAMLSGVVAIIPQYVVGRWFRFGQEFDLLVERFFGPDEAPMPLLIVGVIAFVGGIVWMIASLVGLLRFQSWGRTGTIGSTGFLFGVYLIAFGFRPTFVSPFDDLIAFADSALFGAVVLLAYAKGYGTEWFAKPNPAKD